MDFIVNLPRELTSEIISFQPVTPSAKIIKELIQISRELYPKYYYGRECCFEEYFQWDKDEAIANYNNYKIEERLSKLPKHPLAVMLKNFILNHGEEPDDIVDFETDWSFPNWFQEQIFEDHVYDMLGEWENYLWEQHFE